MNEMIFLFNRAIKNILSNYILHETIQGRMQEFWKWRALKISDQGNLIVAGGNVPENFEN